MREFKNLLKLLRGDIDFLTKKQEAVLIETVFRGTSYPFGFKNRMWVSTAQKVTMSLVDKWLLRIVREEPWHAGMKKRIYGVTPIGFSVAFELCALKYPQKDFMKLVMANKSVVPLVLGEWDYFQKRGVEKDALERLGYVTRYFVKACRGRFRDLLEEGEYRSEVFRDLFTQEFYSLFPGGMTTTLLNKKDYLRWYKVLTENRRIRPIVLKILKKESKVARFHVRLVEEIMAMTKRPYLLKTGC